MIDFDKLENQKSALSNSFKTATPFPFVKIDEFADDERLSKALSRLSSPEANEIGKSRDYVFAKNKYEKSTFSELSTEFHELYEDLMSDKFQSYLQEITGMEGIFIDPEFHGGGLHQGGKGSFLDMHVDFNYHPENSKWLRKLNILLYLNKDWDDSYGGKLKLQHKETGVRGEVEPLFNRCVIMLTDGDTLHGYDQINFPENTYRRSIATYAYVVETSETREARSTVWYPENSGQWKRILGSTWPHLVKLKNSILGSGTSKNK